MFAKHSSICRNLGTESWQTLRANCIMFQGAQRFCLLSKLAVMSEQGMCEVSGIQELQTDMKREMPKR